MQSYFKRININFVLLLLDGVEFLWELSLRCEFCGSGVLECGFGREVGCRIFKVGFVFNVVFSQHFE